MPEWRLMAVQSLPIQEQRIRYNPGVIRLLCGWELTFGSHLDSAPQLCELTTRCRRIRNYVYSTRVCPDTPQQNYRFGPSNYRNRVAIPIRLTHFKTCQEAGCFVCVNLWVPKIGVC